MTIDLVLNEISKNGKIKVVKTSEEIGVSVMRGDYYERVLRIYPQFKTAEFLDINDEWDELQGALEEVYKEFPQLIILTRHLNNAGYDIIF